MAESAVSFLLDQLSVLLREETQLLRGLKQEVECIQNEMRQMQEFLRVADQKEESNPGLKEWVRQLREISYDVEDVLDTYMLRFGGRRGTAGFSGCIKNVYASVENLKARHQIGNVIQAIMKRLQNLSISQQRYRDMYAVLDQGSSSAVLDKETYDGRGDALFLEDDDVIGIEKPKKQLLEWVGSMDNGVEVISVVGMGGLGKTTLVKKVYDDDSMKRDFNSHVWIVASEYTDVKHLLANLVKKLVAEIQKPPPQELEDMSLDDMRNFIKEFLKVKNYIIVLDDVWTISTWEAIRSALPKRGVHGCIIITTRDSSIADASCSETNHVHYLQPLTVYELKKLFNRKAFPRSSCPPYITEYAENILNRCDGLPLAIVVIGGLLATKGNTAEQWEFFNRSVGHELDGGGRLKILGKILSLSYRDLSYFLKYCYLYLSIFPEDGLIEKETIIRLWIAEGFVQPKQDQTVEEVAADYLNELLSRSLIQVALRHVDGRVRAFRIHDLLRDYIISQSREVNIVTINGGGEEMQWPSRIRRFAIQKPFSFSGGTYNFECLRSLILCSGNVDLATINELVSRCRLLKVLDLRGGPLESIPIEVFKLDNPGLKEWVRQLREISYDVEDVLDTYMLRFGGRRGTAGFSGCIKNVYALVKNLKARHQIGNEIQAIMKRLQNLSSSQQRFRDMYAFMEQGFSSVILNKESYDGRGDALFLEDDEVVGIEEPKKKLLEWVGLKDDGLEVISVVGMGGMGKTTLVKKVYDDESVKRGFTSHVWIVASEYLDIKHLLEDLVRKLVAKIQKPPPQELEDMSLDDMRNFIKEFLKEKNYVIVLDDVWDVSTWEALRSTLPKRSVNGCIIITTRSSSIANASCSETNHVYNIQPLSTKESEALFYRKAFPRSSCPPYITEYAENILKRCDGLPLAIVVIGGLLAMKNNTAEEWEVFNRSLGQELEGGGSLQTLGKILSLSYRDLSYYLKHCYLYLSIFPEDHLLEMETIIRLWIAKGFVQSKQGKNMEEVAADYPNQLISRSLIQVALRNNDGRVRAFRIHDLLRDYIISKSREVNIVTTNGGGDEMQLSSRIRRFAIQKSFSIFQETYNFECLRSLILFSEYVDIATINEMVKRCRLLKVLDLRGAPLESIPNEVFKLYHLKYLCLRNTMIKVIPKSIKYLKKLETLDLKNTSVTELPVEISKLHHLRHLIIYKYNSKVDGSFDSVQSFKAPSDIGSCFPSLLKLSYIDADEIHGIKMVREIGKLTHLRTFGMAKLRSEDGKELCCSIAKLTNLRSLKIVSIEEGERLDLDYPLNMPFLRTLQVSGYLEKIPQWIPSLNGLTNLYILESRLREDPLNCLQDLPKLTILRIHSAAVEGLCFQARGFQKLKVLELKDMKLMKGVIVEKGSMPLLEKWYMWNCKMMTDLPRGLEHLLNLGVVYFINMADDFVEKVAESQRNKGWLAHVPNVCIN